MKDAQHYAEILLKYSDPESVTAVYAEVSNHIKELEVIKSTCRAKMLKYLTENGEPKVRTAVATFGFVNQKPKFKLNESKWQKATLSNPKLYSLSMEAAIKRDQLIDAQKEYMEEVEQKPRIYIR